MKQALRCCTGVKENVSFQLKRSLSTTYEELLTNIGFTKLSLKESPPNDTVVYGLERT